MIFTHSSHSLPVRNVHSTFVSLPLASLTVWKVFLPISWKRALMRFLIAGPKTLSFSFAHSLQSSVLHVPATQALASFFVFVFTSAATAACTATSPSPPLSQIVRHSPQQSPWNGHMIFSSGHLWAFFFESS